MRIAGSTIRRNYLSRYEKNYNDKYASEKKIYSGRQFDRGSENPINAAKALRIRRTQAELETYQANLKTMDSIYTTAETSMLQVSSIIQNVYEKLVEGAHGTRNQDDMNILAMEIDNYAEEMVQSLNVDVADRKIFGGCNNDTVAFKIESSGYSGEKYVTYNGVALNSSSDPLTFPMSNTSFLDIGIGMTTDERTNRIDDQTGLPATFNGAECTGCGTTSKVAAIDLDTINKPGETYVMVIYAGGKTRTVSFVNPVDDDGTHQKLIDTINAAMKEAFRSAPEITSTDGVTAAFNYIEHPRTYNYSQVNLTSDDGLNMKLDLNSILNSADADETYYSINVTFGNKTRNIDFLGSNDINELQKNIDTALADKFGTSPKTYMDGNGAVHMGSYTGVIEKRDFLDNITPVTVDKYGRIDTSSLVAGKTYCVNLATPKTDGSGEPIVKKDENGEPLYRLDDDGNKIQSIDKNGDPLYETNKAGYLVTRKNSDGTYVYENDENGDPIYQTNADGSIKYETDENGDQVLDANNQPIPLPKYPVYEMEYEYGEGAMIYFTAQDTPTATYKVINEYISNNDLFGSSYYPTMSSTGTISYNAEDASVMVTNGDPDQPFESTEINDVAKNIIQLVLDAGSYLRKGDQQMVARYADLIYAAQSNLSIAITDLGTHSKFIEFNQDRINEIQINLNDKQNDIESTDLPTEITKWKVLESVYNASLQMGASVLSQSIFNYIS